MSNSGIISVVLIIITFVFSYKGFTNQTFFDGYKFEVDKILVNKDYKRLITSGFLHVGWAHLIFNMISLYLFSGLIEYSLGSVKFLIIYFASLVGGDLLSLFVHRHHADYTSVGASGAICGVMFATIALFPGISLPVFILPIFIPAWLYGLLYIGMSIWAIKSKRDNIGHEAHLGGALIGMIIAIIMVPSSLADNYITIIIILVPAIVFIYLIVTKPQILLVDNLYFKKHPNNYSIDHEYNQRRHQQQMEVDRILEKISSKGMNSLTSRERAYLEEHSKK